MKDEHIETSLVIRVTKEIKDKLRRIAKEEEMTMSQIVRILIKKYIKEQEKNYPPPLVNSKALAQNTKAKKPI